MGATIFEFYNFKQDLQAYIEGGDAEMIIEKLRQKKEFSTKFYCSFKVYEDNLLSRLFWADPIGRRNFSNFRDAVSFDATYDTDRYAVTLLAQMHCCCAVILVSFSYMCITHFNIY